MKSMLEHPAICYCCGQKTKNFYVNNKNKRRKYCRDCEKNYTAKERRLNSFKLIDDILSNSKVIESTLEELIDQDKK